MIVANQHGFIIVVVTVAITVVSVVTVTVVSVVTVTVTVVSVVVISLACMRSGICTACVLESAFTAYPMLYCQVSKELAVGHSSPNSPHQTTDSALALFPLLHQLLTCPVFRPVAVSDALIADLSAYLAASASASVSDLAGIAKFQVSSTASAVWVRPVQQASAVPE